MGDSKKDDLDAVREIIEALRPFAVEDQQRIIRWACEKLGIPHQDSESRNQVESRIAPTQFENSLSFDKEEGMLNAEGTREVIDIRSFKEEKEPQTAQQMAAVVAFYLQELAPVDERSDTINSNHVTKYFKQANFPLPKGQPVYVLRNAKNAGYFDFAGETGTYKLNPVGYNLVAFNLPSNISKPPSKKRPKRTKKTKAKPKTKRDK